MKQKQDIEINDHIQFNGDFATIQTNILQIEVPRPKVCHFEENKWGQKKMRLQISPSVEEELNRIMIELTKVDYVDSEGKEYGTGGQEYAVTVKPVAYSNSIEVTKMYKHNSDELCKGKHIPVYVKAYMRKTEESKYVVGLYYQVETV